MWVFISGRKTGKAITQNRTQVVSETDDYTISYFTKQLTIKYINNGIGFGMFKLSTKFITLTDETLNAHDTHLF
jgi:hypothetical protein